MATVTQRLAFLISANADQAIRAFDKTANAAEKQMGKATKSIDKLGVSMTKFGAAGLAAAGTLGMGLAKLAQGAIDDQKAQALLAEQLRKTTGATDAQIKKVEQFIDSTARATGVVDDQLRPSLAQLVRATGDVGKAQSLLKLSMDVSAGSGRDLSSVVTAMSRAALGNFSALTRLGIPIDENTKKSKDFSKVIDLLSSRFGGQAAVAADTYAGKIARAKVAIGEAGEQLGSAFIPFVEKGATATANAVNSLSKFDQATGGAVGKLAAFGTVGLGVVSGLSLIGGQAIKIRNNLTTLGDDGSRSLNNLGEAAKYAGLGLATIGLSEAAFSVLNEISDAAGNTDRSLQQLNRTLKGTNADQIVASFRDLVKQEDKVLRFSNIWTDFGKEITIVGGSSSRNIEDIDRAFNKLLKESGPKAAQIVIDALKTQNATLDTSSQQYKDNASLVSRYQARIDDLVGSTETLNKVNDQTNASLAVTQQQYRDLSRVLLDIEDKNAAAVFEKLKQRQQELKDAAAEAARKQAEFKQSVLDSADALRNKLADALSIAKGKLKDAQGAFDAYAKSVSASIMGTLNLSSAQATATDNAKAIADAQQKVNDAQDEWNKVANLIGPGAEEKQAEARTKLADATEALNKALAQPTDFLQVFKDQETAAKTFAGNVQKLLDLGADQALIDQLVSAGADTGNQIAESILNGADPKGKVDQINTIVKSTQQIADDLGTNAAEKYFKNGVTLAENLVNGINSVLAKAKIKLKWSALNKDGKPAKQIKSLTDLFQSDITGAFSLAGIGGDDVPQLASGGIVKARNGGTLALLGEGGQDEAVLPLPAAGGLGGTSITLNVNAGMGADGAVIGKQIVDELVAYQRRVGALPIKVNG